MTGNDRTGGYRIAVVSRTFDLLEAIARSDRPLGVSELARAIGSTKSATFRILATLEERGYVIRDRDQSRYQLGAGFVFLGQRALEDVDLRKEARPILEDLKDRFNETANLGVIVNDRVIYIDIQESDHGLRMAAQVGAQDELHSTSIGKAILAFMPPERLERLLDRELVKRTEKTITDPGILKQELAGIRKTGIARDDGENEAGASCFGAPIFDQQGEVIAAISVSGPDSRITGEKAADIATAIRKAASDITRRLGGEPPQWIQTGGNGNGSPNRSGGR
jgi:IclR family transcriptional regulator, KDG regulon repressor